MRVAIFFISGNFEQYWLGLNGILEIGSAKHYVFRRLKTLAVSTCTYNQTQCALHSVFKDRYLQHTRHQSCDTQKCKKTYYICYGG